LSKIKNKYLDMNIIKNLFDKKILLQVVGIMTALVLGLSSCDDDDAPVPANLPTESIMDLVDGTTDLSTLKAAIDAAMLRETLNGNGPFTVFAPTNAAFAEVDSDVLAYLLATPAELTKVLTYHVVSGSVLSTDLTAGKVTTLNGEAVTVDLANGVMINNAKVTTANVLATNGVVHIIDKVLIPSNLVLPEARNIVEIASATPTLSILVEALTLFPDLVTLLSSAGENTVFAPDNDAFVALLGAIGQTQLSDIPASVIENILKYHVITAAKIASTDLSDGQTATTALGEDITVAINDSGVFISNSQVTTADVQASNGIIHIMKGVMVPPSILPIVGTIVAPAYFNVNFTTLIAAVLGADPSILTTLLGNGPSNMGLTLFAPTNDAFIAAGITELPDQATLDAVLTYHVIDATIMASGLPNTDAAAPAKIATLGGDFYLSNKGDGVFINGSTQVTATDIAGSNGVVHVIDQTLMPPSQTVVEIAVALSTAASAEFTTLVALLTDPAQADVLNAIVGDGPYTILAPTDAAFAEISDVTSGLSAAQISEVLKYHVIGAQAYSTDLVDGLAPATFNSQTLTFNVGSNVTISDQDTSNTDATVISVNINGTNGVIHVIDKVLIPTL
jgi:transforming growth factor-beta-induced protein